MAAAVRQQRWPPLPTAQPHSITGLRCFAGGRRLAGTKQASSAVAAAPRGTSVPYALGAVARRPAVEESAAIVIGPPPVFNPGTSADGSAAGTQLLAVVAEAGQPAVAVTAQPLTTGDAPAGGDAAQLPPLAVAVGLLRATTAAASDRAGTASTDAHAVAGRRRPLAAATAANFSAK